MAFNLTPQQARAKWVEALRSGEHEQGCGRLHFCNGTKCCLGVACIVFMQHETGLTVAKAASYCPTGPVFTYLGHTAGLPLIVKDWLGLADTLGEYSARTASLSLHNDQRKTFAEIADIIEAAPPGLLVEEAA